MLAMSVQSAFADTPINVANQGIKKTAQFKNWKNYLDTPTKVGTLSRGLFCSGAIDMAYTTAYNTYFVSRVNKVFKEKSEALGYPKYDAGDSAFGDAASTGADFRIGFSLMALNDTVCVNGKDVSGTGKVKLKVELFSSKLQKVVYSRTVEGTMTAEDKIKEELFNDTMIGNAMDAMFADPKYVDAFRDAPPAVAESPADLIVVKNGYKPKDSVTQDAKGVLSAVVTIEAGNATGSGFYIGRDGYVITNQHVVGEAKYVKVKMVGGYAVAGEVIRRDPARDVALIKTDIQPPTAMFVRAAPAKVGEEVYAVGSPFGEQLSSTVTRGILSGERTLNEQKFMQSDVAINPGNSGGPLVDADGGLIAIADLKRANASGIGLFIPIAEVLEKLGLNLQ